jgi:hypothetical protein
LIRAKAGRLRNALDVEVVDRTEVPIRTANEVVDRFHEHAAPVHMASKLHAAEGCVAVSQKCPL